MQKIYNILAKCIRQILINFDYTDLQKYNSLSCNARDEYKKEILQAIPGFYCDNMNKKSLNTFQFKSLANYIEHFMVDCDTKKKYDLMLMTLIEMDSLLEKILYNMHNEAFSRKEVKPLNSNYKEVRIKLFPRVNCKWERNSRGKNTHIRIDNYFKNLLIIDYNSVINSYNDKHFFLQNDYEISNKYSFAAVPYCNVWNHEIEYINEENHNLMHINYIGNKSEDIKFLEGKIEQAMENDIIIFPEVHGCCEIDEEISEFLSEELMYKLPQITILPSCWENRKNYVSILDATGEIIFTQRKYIPYEEEYNGEHYIEDLENYDREVNVIHCDGMGRIAILICRDFLETRYIEEIVELYKLNMILVPSFSTGNYDFKENAGICKSLNCSVLWVNSCSAYNDAKKENFDIISFLSKAEVKNVINGDNEFKHPCEKILSNCKCDGCMLEYNIEL